MSNNGRKIYGLALIGVAAAALGVPAPSATAQEMPPPANTGALTWNLGADVVTTYMFRGIEQEDSGLILQPYVEVGTPIGDTGVDLYMGQWNSIHSEKTRSADTGSDAWYESDFYVGVSFGVTDQVDLGVSYVGYYFPNGSSGDVQELDFLASFDDSAFLGDYSLSPYALIAFEIKDATGDEGVYAEIGGALSLENVIASEDMPVNLNVPVTIGLSLHDYYTDSSGDDEFIGFLSAGLIASMPLDFIPSNYGAWAASAGITGYFVNDNAQLLDDGDEFEVVLSAGIGLEY